MHYISAIIEKRENYIDDKVEVARLRGRCLMIQDKIIAIQQECEEICLQSDAPDYRALYFKLFARTEEV